MKSVYLATFGLLTMAGCGAPVGHEPAVPLEVVAAADVPAAGSTRLAPTAAQQAAWPATRPIAAIDRALIISIDGLRPDLLLRASTPRLRGLCSSGCYSFWAETVPEAYTLPPHVSMLTGCPVAKHGVSWNHYIEESYPNVPTLFELAKRAGYSTALVAGKMKFIALTRPGSIDWKYLPPDEPVRDDEIAAQAEHILREHRPTLLVVHFPDVDNVGHESGWGSAEQMEAIQRADQAVGLLLNVVGQLGLAGSTLIIITSDHGGAGKGHDENDPRSHFIPWIASGPGLRQDFDLTRVLVRPVQIQDTFATVCALLSIPPGEANEGRPVLEIVAEATCDSIRD